jgi:hypothetical protein
MRTTIEIPDLAHQRLKVLAQAKDVSLAKLLLELSDQALGLSTDAQTAVISSPVTGFLKLKIGRPVTSEALNDVRASARYQRVAGLGSR